MENVPNECKGKLDYPHKFIIGNPQDGITTKKYQELNSHVALISQLDPNKVDDAFKDNHWVKAMKEDLE